MDSQNSIFKNKVAVVTGAAQGIGKAVADALTEQGAIVARLDIAYTAQAADADHCYGLDVADHAAVHEVIEGIEQQLGAVDFLVSAAGILRMGELCDASAEDLAETLRVNTGGVFNVCQAVAKKMRARKSGSIVAVSSNAAATPRAGMGTYCASKAAVSQLVRCLGLELAPHGVRCNLVAPGSTDTAMQRQLWTDDQGRARAIAGNLDQYRLGIPLQRIATPQMIADAVMFLLSPSAAHITMETITVDGGATLGT